VSGRDHSGRIVIGGVTLAAMAIFLAACQTPAANADSIALAQDTVSCAATVAPAMRAVLEANPNASDADKALLSAGAAQTASAANPACARSAADTAKLAADAAAANGGARQP
jgi:ABC-type uncharacterized transport system auxiliary subunit